FAPSPTGALHMGGVRTALFNYLFARGRDGAFILRMEDTDRTRSRQEFETALITELRWLGLEWDEGPGMDKEGRGPYRQSERIDIYRDLAHRLLEKKLAYRCCCTRERLSKLKESQQKAGLPPRYDGRCRGLNKAPEDKKSVLRFIIPEKAVVFNDLLHGPLTFEKSAFGDFIILTPNEEPTYNFASAVDDGLMEISHVIRGDDHLSNTPRQILLMEALGFSPPQYAHLPLVLGPARKPLSKRESGAAVAELREEGYLPQTLLNAAARLGWAPGEGLKRLSDMASEFSIKKLSRSPSIFDTAILRGLNRAVIAGMDADDIIRLAALDDLSGDKSLLLAAVEAVQDNAYTIKELKALITPLIEKPVITEEAAALINTPDGKALLKAALEELNNNTVTYDSLIKNIKEKTGLKGRALFMPLRCALTGAVRGIELDRIFTLLGAGEAEERIKEALAISKTEAQPRN
ncbi:MAG: glutamate--tRNA ligase, partial [Thermodesulfobacteriota bacterium]